MEHKLFIFLVAHSGIKDALINKFRSFSELKKYAKCAPDPELLGKIKVCTTPYWLKGYSISYKILSLVRQWNTLFHEKPQQLLTWTLFDRVIGFVLLRSVIGPKNARHSQPIRYKTKNKCNSVAHVCPAS